MDFSKYAILGQEMGKSLTTKFYLEASKLWETLEPESKEKAKKVFYRNAEEEFGKRPKQSEE